MDTPRAEQPAGPDSSRGLSLAPLRGLRPAAPPDRLGRLLCPPYDVITPSDRAALLAADPDNAVAVILPRSDAVPTVTRGSDVDDDPYARAARRLDGWVADGLYQTDPAPALYVYEMRTSEGHLTRGLVGAVALRDPADGVIIPHENTMAGPVADRLALMRATSANLEPIYLVYDGGGAASQLVADVQPGEEIASAVTPDGTTHRLWATTDPAVHAVVDDDLSGRRALIADGHHRYATYLALQRERRGSDGPGPWDRGLTLLVDSAAYGPQVHAIHRVVMGLTVDDALVGAARVGHLDTVTDPDVGLAALDGGPGFAAVLTDGTTTAVLRGLDPTFVDSLRLDSEPTALTDLDVTVVHRGLLLHAWGRPDTTETVGYAHSVDEAIADARRTGGTAVLLRPTPVAAVAAVAAAGARMPRKSTLFTPKPASGLVMRRFADER